MAISDSEKTDFLWKRLLFGVSKTAAAADKAGSNEIIPSPITVLPNSVWKNADLIPAQPPVADTDEVLLRTGAGRIAATYDPTSPANVAWLATATHNDISTRQTDFIPPTFGSNYAVKVYLGDPAVGPAARVFPDTTGEEWVFDYTAGVLLFTGAIPSGKTATIGSGTVSAAGNGVFFEAYQYQGERGVGGAAGAANGFQLPLGPIADVGDGSWSPGAVPLADDTPVSDAIDMVNEILGLLIPAQPPAFPNGALTISNLSGSAPRLASGVTDNSTNSTLLPGDPVNRITAAGVSSNVFNDVGPGKVGIVTARLNGGSTGVRVLTGSGDNGTYSGLVIADQKDFPVATPGFWKSIDISVLDMPTPIGVNKLSISHSGAGTTGTVYFVRDAMVNAPVISQGRAIEGSAGTITYSSSVPHYNTGATLLVDAYISNFSGETYYGGGDPLVISGTNGIFTAQTYSYTALGIATPFNRQDIDARQISTQVVPIDGATHGSGIVQATARNVNGPTGATLSTNIVLVKRGTVPAGKIDELSVPVSGLGSIPNASNAMRVALGAGDAPAGPPNTFNPAVDLETYEATVVAGVLKHDQTNYATGYLPAGPNLSTGRSGSQYVTFSFKRASVSTFKIVIAGSYADCRVKLRGVSDDLAVSPNAASGWWNAFRSYDGAGVPGETGDTQAGCALGAVMTGGSGTFTITFGTQSSTNATGNEILVRLKLTAGQSITALSFTA